MARSFEGPKGALSLPASFECQHTLGEKAWSLVLEGFNLVLGGVLERGAANWDAYQQGKMSFGEMALRNLGDYGVFAVSTIASRGTASIGRNIVGKVVLTRVGFEQALKTSFAARLTGYTTEGSVAGALFSALEQSGQNVLHVAWNEETKSFEWDTLGWNAMFGGIGGAAISGLGEWAAKLGPKIRDSDVLQAVQDIFRHGSQALEIGARHALSQASEILAIHQSAPVVRSAISLSVGIGNADQKFVDTPQLASQTLHTATEWLIEQIGCIKGWMQDKLFSTLSSPPITFNVISDYYETTH